MEINMKAIRAIIPAAGKGRRLAAVSGDVPKAMCRVGDTPMLDIVLENISFIEDSNIYIVIGYLGEMIMDHLGDRFTYVWQHEQLGTGHAVRVCEEHFRDFDGCVLVTFGDKIGRAHV